MTLSCNPEREIFCQTRLMTREPSQRVGILTKPAMKHSIAKVMNNDVLIAPHVEQPYFSYFTQLNQILFATWWGGGGGGKGGKK